MSEFNPFGGNKTGLPEHVAEAINSIVGELEDVLLPGLTRYTGLVTRAWDEVRKDNPHLFTDYRQPRNAKEKIKMRKRAEKIASRAKKRHYAVQVKLEEMEAPDVKKLVEDSITEVHIRRGIASPETEIDYLEPVQNLFRSKAIKARTTMLRLVLSLRSQFFQSLRHFSSHDRERSTTQRFGTTLN